MWSSPPVSLYFVHVLYLAFDPEASILYTSYLNCRACWEDRPLDTHIIWLETASDDVLGSWWICASLESSISIFLYVCRSVVLQCHHICPWSEKVALCVFLSPEAKIIQKWGFVIFSKTVWHKGKCTQIHFFFFLEYFSKSDSYPEQFL